METSWNNDLAEMVKLSKRAAQLLDDLARAPLPAGTALHFGCARSAMIHATREFEQALGLLLQATEGAAGGNPA